MRILQFRRRAPTLSAATVLFCWIGVWAMVFVTLKTLYRLRCQGRRLVPARGPIVYVANHQSLYDPPIVGCLVGDRPFASLAKSGLFRFAPFACLIRTLGAIPLRLGRGDAGAVRSAIDQIRRGGCVLIFPEGGRSWDGSVQTFKPGILTILRRAPAPVVPVAIEGAFEIWPRTRRRPRLRGRLMVRAAAPIPPGELLAAPPHEAMERLRGQIDSMRLELRAELRRRTRGRYPPPGPGDLPCRKIDARSEGRAPTAPVDTVASGNTGSPDLAPAPES